MIQSTTVIFISIAKAIEKASDGAVKYFVTEMPSIIIITINGYKIDINHVLRSSILIIKAKPKNITKNNMIETISCINYIISFTFCIPIQTIFYIKKLQKQRLMT